MADCEVSGESGDAPKNGHARFRVTGKLCRPLGRLWSLFLSNDCLAFLVYVVRGCFCNSERMRGSGVQVQKLLHLSWHLGPRFP